MIEDEKRLKKNFSIFSKSSFLPKNTLQVEYFSLISLSIVMKKTNKNEQ